MVWWSGGLARMSPLLPQNLHSSHQWAVRAEAGRRGAGGCRGAGAAGGLGAPHGRPGLAAAGPGDRHLPRPSGAPSARCTILPTSRPFAIACCGSVHVSSRCVLDSIAATTLLPLRCVLESIAATTLLPLACTSMLPAQTLDPRRSCSLHDRMIDIARVN